MRDENFSTLLQERDPDRRLAALFARPDDREALLALYAFNQEIARIAEATTESLIGEMKLTWWRDAVTDLYAAEPRVRRHAVTEGLAPLTARLPQDALIDLIDARFDDVAARPHTDLADLLDYVDRTAGQLARLALFLCGAPEAEALARTAGRAWGLTGLMRAFPHRAAIGRAPVCNATLVAAGGTPAMLAQGLGSDRAAQALAPVRELAQAAIAELKTLGPLPQEAVPAIGYAVLAPAYLKSLPDNPFHGAREPALLGRQLRLNWLALTGR